MVTREQRPQSRAERLIAASRLILSAAALVASRLDPVEASPGVPAILIIYAIYSAGLALWNFQAVSYDARLPLITHSFDLAFFSTLVLMTGAAASPYFLYFAFPLLSAILRFGRRGMIVTAIIVMLVFVLTLVYAWGDVERTEIDRFVNRAVFLITIVTLLIYLAESQQRSNLELARVATWPRSSWVSLPTAVHQLLENASGLLGSIRVLLAFEDGTDQQAFLGAPGPTGFVVEEQPREIAVMLLAVSSDPSLVTSTARQQPVTFVRSGQHLVRTESAPLPESILREFDVKAMVTVPFRGDFVRGQIFFLDVPRPLQQDLMLGKIVADIVGARLDHYHTVQQLKRGAAAEERVRVARDLHDSILQSLTGAALQLQTVPKIMARNPEEATARVREIQEVIAADQRELRWFIDNLQGDGAGGGAGVPYDLETRLASLRQRFSQHWGLEVEIRTEPNLRHLPTAVYLEIYSIVSEAVANAAKHANAKRVEVDLQSSGGQVTVRVRDDGKGFPFHGRYTLAQLQASERGPVTLKERIASLQGDMCIDSSAAGSRIEIRVPVAG